MPRTLSVADVATAWRTVAEPRARTLHILAICHEGRMVGVWPLVTYCDRRLRIVRQLTAEGSEYIAPLVEPGPQAAEHLEKLYDAARGLGDVLFMPFLRRDGALDTFLRRHRGRCLEDNFLKAPWIELHSYPDWSSFLSTVSHSHLRGLNREYRRLSKVGEIAFRIEDSRAAGSELARMLANKDGWMARHARFNDWLRTPEYRAFLAAMLSVDDPRDGLTLFTLRVNGVQIAAELSAVDGTRVEALIRTYDPTWSRYSPGDILLQEIVRWAFEHGLDYDFRLGNESYKAKWARMDAGIFSCRMALNVRGRAAIEFWRLRRRTQRLRARMGIGRIIRRIRSAS